jgi:hemoglobin
MTDSTAGLVRRLAGTALLATVVAASAVPARADDSLYKRLGGYDAIAAVTDDFIVRLATDTKLTKFFIGVSDDHKKRIRQLVVDQLCAATGGPCVYIGQDMKTSHKGLKITDDDWKASLVDFGMTMDKFKVPQRERDELGAALAKLKADIVIP